jgi:Bacterial conjugation TrbI-like protein
MNGKSSEHTTTEDLKAITEAPQREEPLVSASEFPTELTRSSRPIWTKPIPKLMTIGVVLVPVFVLAAFFLVNGGRVKQPQNVQSSPVLNAKNTAQTEAVPEELERLRKENGTLKANAAIGDQNTLQSHQKNAGRQAGKIPKIDAKPTASNPTRSSQPVASDSTPQIISRANPPRIVSAPAAQREPAQFIQPSEKTARTIDPTGSQAVDPMQQWQQLARVGSYGSSSHPEDSSPVEWSNSNNSIPSTPAVASNSSTDAVPTAHIAPTSAISTNAVWTSDATLDQAAEPQNSKLEGNVDNSFVISAQPNTSDPETASNFSEVAAQVPILRNEEAAILADQVQQHSLIAGATSLGTLTTPIILDDVNNNHNARKPQSDQFTIALSQPLINSAGQVAMPAGTQLLVQVDELSQTGQVEVSATTAVWDEGGFKKELTLPSGVIQIRGENGKPLVAQQFEDRGKAIASMDAGQFLLGAVRRSAELFTRSNSRIQTGNGTTVVTEDNPTPNILAGALEGGTDAILDSITARNQRAIQDMEKRSSIHLIESGQPVQIFVNQSMRLPS